MKLTPTQIRAHNALRAEGRITSGDRHHVTRPTVEVLERRGLVELRRQDTERTRHHIDGTTSTYVITTWTAELLPQMPEADALAELDLVIANGEGMLRPAQREQAAAYVAHTAPLAALEGSPAKDPGYSVVRAYKDALSRPVTWLLDQVRMLRHMTGQCPLPGGVPGPSGPRTDVWVLTARSTGPRPGRELGRVRASTQNAAALLGNSLLNTRGGYRMRRLAPGEVGPWVQDFRASGLVLRLTHRPKDNTFLVSQVTDGTILVIRPTPEEARRDALADLSSLYSALAPRPREPIHAD